MCLFPFPGFCKQSRHHSLFKNPSPLPRFAGCRLSLGYYLTGLERLVLFSAVHQGIRGAQRSPEGQWGRVKRDTRFPWQPDRMEPVKLYHVMFEIPKKGACYYLFHLWKRYNKLWILFLFKHARLTKGLFQYPDNHVKDRKGKIV